MKNRLLDKLSDPNFHVKFHGYQAILWFILAFPICAFLSNSIPVVVFISVLALVLAELSAWQAARTEVKQMQLEKREQERLDNGS